MALKRKIQQDIEFIFPYDPGVSENWKTIDKIGEYMEDFENKGIPDDFLDPDREEEPTIFVLNSLTARQLEKIESTTFENEKKKLAVTFGVKEIKNYWYKDKFYESIKPKVDGRFGKVLEDEVIRSLVFFTSITDLLYVVLMRMSQHIY